MEVEAAEGVQDQAAVETEESSEPATQEEEEEETLKSALSEALQNYIKERYPRSGVSLVHVKDELYKLSVIGRRFNSKNFWYTA